MIFENDNEAFNYLILNGCTHDRGIIYPPQNNFEAWNSNKLNWEAINYLIQEWDYGFERYYL